jgi:FkbM family methyltransferase
MIYKWIANSFPFLGKYKRFLVALVDSILPIRNSYSQHKEDVFILQTLKRFNLSESIYVDIGANHPTDISNTYLLYRNGLNGLIIEPNPELISLFSKFRTRDIALPIGCSDSALLLKFNISKTPVVSSFLSAREDNFYKSIYVPVLPVDLIVKPVQFKFICFMSIDVEGLNLEVLKGATYTLKSTLLLCIEYDNDSEKNKFIKVLGQDFSLIEEFGCNAFFLNRNLSESLT